MKQIHIRLSNKTKAALEKRARLAKQSVQQYVEDLIENDGGTIRVPKVMLSEYNKYLAGVLDPRD